MLHTETRSVIIDSQRTWFFDFDKIGEFVSDQYVNGRKALRNLHTYSFPITCNAVPISPCWLPKVHHFEHPPSACELCTPTFFENIARVSIAKTKKSTTQDDITRKDLIR